MENDLQRLVIMVTKRTFYGFLINLFALSVLLASNGNAQYRSIKEVSVPIHLKNVSLTEAFQTIESKTDFKFTYEEKDLNREVSISFHTESATLDKVLLKIARKAELNFRQVNNNIHVKKAKTRNVRGLAINKEDEAPVTVTGNVSGMDDEPLIGVNVVVKGTGHGTITDLDGNFKLDVPSEESVLVFSYVGYSSQEIEVGDQLEINVKLAADVTGLQEVVVVGYGEQKKINLTGSISEIESEDIEKRAVNSTTQALQGLAPNLNVDVNSDGGAADASMNINVRGTGSLSSSAPFILVDGVRTSQSELAALNPEVIQSISVLKDAASAAIYGAQAAYGVILIETKKGERNQKFTINYTNNFRLKERIFVPPSVNTIRYAEVLNIASDNYSGSVAIDDEQMEKIRSFVEGELQYGTEADPNNPNQWLGIQSGTSNGWYSGFANTDWWDVMYNDLGFTQQHALSAGGGSENLSYHISGGLINDPGQLAFGDENEEYTRYNLNSNISANITEWLTISNNTRYYREKNIFPATLEGGSRGRLYHDIMRFSPLAPYKLPPVLDDDGNEIVSEQLALLPAFNEYNGFNTYDIDDLVSTLGAEIKLGKAITLKGNYIFKKVFYDRTLNFKKWQLIGPDGRPSITYQANNNQITKDLRKTNYSSFNFYASYNKSFFDQHNLGVMVGYQQEENDHFELNVSRRDVIANNLNSLNIAVGDIIGPDNPISTWGTLGVFGRMTYNFNEKYLVEFNGRYDGSSKFAAGNRFGFFPSVSVGYNIFKEDFWAPLEDIISTFKIRASWGKLGNQNVSSYLYLSNIPIRTRLAWAIDGERPVYTQIPNIVSPDITWETSITKNIGIDFSLFDNKLTSSFDIYERQTDNMFGPSAALPATLGTDPPETNSASLKTNGWEFVIGWREHVSNTFNYHLNLMLSDNTTTITSYNNPEKVISNLYEGQVLGEIWGFEADALFQTQGELDEYLSEVDLSYFGTNWQPGDVKYKDLNGDGVVNIGDNTVNNPGDRKVIGNSNPRYRISFQGGVEWHNFDISMLWQGIGKRDFWMDSYATLFWGWNSRGHSRITEASMDFWSPDRPDGYLPLPLEGGGRAGFGKDRHESTRYIQNAAYMRLKNMSIGYTLPSEFTQRFNVEKMRFYINGENLLTLTKMWENFDPELVTTGSRSRTSVGRAYPLARVYGLGIDVTF